MGVGADFTELRGRGAEPWPPPVAGTVVCGSPVRFHRSEGVEVEALRRLDWVGRSQLPVDSAGVSRRSRRVRSAWEEDHIAVWRAEEEVHG